MKKYSLILFIILQTFPASSYEDKILMDSLIMRTIKLEVVIKEGESKYKPVGYGTGIIFKYTGNDYFANLKKGDIFLITSYHVIYPDDYYWFSTNDNLSKLHINFIAKDIKLNSKPVSLIHSILAKNELFDYVLIKIDSSMINQLQEAYTGIYDKQYIEEDLLTDLKLTPDFYFNEMEYIPEKNLNEVRGKQTYIYHNRFRYSQLIVYSVGNIESYNYIELEKAKKEKKAPYVIETNVTASSGGSGGVAFIENNGNLQILGVLNWTKENIAYISVFDYQDVFNKLRINQDFSNFRNYDRPPIFKSKSNQISWKPKTVYSKKVHLSKNMFIPSFSLIISSSVLLCTGGIGFALSRNQYYKLDTSVNIKDFDTYVNLQNAFFWLTISSGSLFVITLPFIIVSIVIKSRLHKQDFAFDINADAKTVSIGSLIKF